MENRSDNQIAAWLALFLFGIYLFSFSGRLYSQDSMLMFSLTESIVKRNEFSTDQMWTLYKARDELGIDGEAYSKTGYGTSLLAAPLYSVALALPDLGLVQTTLLTSSVVIALTSAFVFLSARRLKFSRGVSIGTAFLFGLATPAFVYAKQFWSEPYALFTLFGAFFFLQRFRDTNRTTDALIAAIALGFAIAVRTTNAALVPLFMWYGFFDSSIIALKQRSSKSLIPLASFVITLAAFALSIACYNWARYGNPINSGYRPDETFDTPFFLGAYGLLFSPGKGLLVFSPFLAALAFSAIAFFRRAKPETILILFTFIFYLFTFSLWYYWWGGTNWGPRFLVPTLPFLVLMIAPSVEAMFAPVSSIAHAGFKILFSILSFASVAIQLLGVAIPSLAYRAQMLRVSSNPDMDAIFLPQFSPILGHFNLLKPRALDFAWVRLIDNSFAIDWLVVTLTVAFILVCGVMLFRPPSFVLRRSSFVSFIVLFDLAILLAAFSLYRYHDDVRFGGLDGYQQALRVVEKSEQSNDVMILNNDVFTLYLLDENKSEMRWYGLSRNPKQWDDATRALLDRISRRANCIWFLYDDSTNALPDPTRDWLEEYLRVIDERDFDDGVHLKLFALRSSP